MRCGRSLAGHIARRRNGLVALAIQYGHMRTAFDTWASEGYGSRSRNGIHDLIELETAFATAGTAAALREDLDNGGGDSRPPPPPPRNAATPPPPVPPLPPPPPPPPHPPHK